MSTAQDNTKTDDNKMELVHRCKTCLGVGLVKRAQIKCENCGSCVPLPPRCPQPYEPCEYCDGTGTQPAYQKYSSTITKSEMLLQQQKTNKTKD
jgi:hypothetical protein